MPRSFAVAERRDFSYDAATLFAGWIDADLRQTFLVSSGRGERLVKCDFREGGEEIVEARWRNKVSSRKISNIRIIRQNTLVVTQSIIDINAEQAFATTDIFELRPKEDLTTVVILATQVMCVKPMKSEIVKLDLGELMDRFAEALTAFVK